MGFLPWPLILTPLALAWVLSLGCWAWAWGLALAWSCWSPLLEPGLGLGFGSPLVLGLGLSLVLAVWAWPRLGLGLGIGLAFDHVLGQEMPLALVWVLGLGCWALARGCSAWLRPGLEHLASLCPFCLSLGPGLWHQLWLWSSALGQGSGLGLELGLEQWACGCWTWPWPLAPGLGTRLWLLTWSCPWLCLLCPGHLGGLSLGLCFLCFSLPGWALAFGWALVFVSLEYLLPSHMASRFTKADSTLRCSQAVPHPSTKRALCRLTSEVKRDPVHSTRYGRQRRSLS